MNALLRYACVVSLSTLLIVCSSEMPKLPDELNQNHMSISEWSDTMDIICTEHDFPLNLSRLVNLTYSRPNLASFSVTGCPIAGTIPASWKNMNKLIYLSVDCVEYGDPIGNDKELVHSIRDHTTHLLALRIKACGLVFDFAKLIVNNFPTIPFMDFSENELYGSIADAPLIGLFCNGGGLLGRFANINDSVAEVGYKCTENEGIHMLEGRSSSTAYGLLYKYGNLSAARSLPVILDFSYNNIQGGPEAMYSDLTGIGVSRQICSAGCVSLVINDDGDIPCVTAHGRTVWYMQNNPWTMEHQQHRFASGFVVNNRHNWCREEEADIVLLVTWSVGLGLLVLAIAAGLFQRWRYWRRVHRKRLRRLALGNPTHGVYTIGRGGSAHARTPTAVPAGSNIVPNPKAADLSPAEVVLAQADPLVTELRSDESQTLSQAPPIGQGQLEELSLSLGAGLPVSRGPLDPDSPTAWGGSRDTLWNKVVSTVGGKGSTDPNNMQVGLLKDHGASSSQLEPESSTATDRHASMKRDAGLGSTPPAFEGAVQGEASPVMSPPRGMVMDQDEDEFDETKRLNPQGTSKGERFCDCMTLPIKMILDFVDQGTSEGERFCDCMTLPIKKILDFVDQGTSEGERFCDCMTLPIKKILDFVDQGTSEGERFCDCMTLPIKKILDFVDQGTSEGERFCDCMTLPIKKILDFVDQIPQSDRGVQLRCIIAIAVFSAELAMMALLLFEQGGIQLLLFLNIIVQMLLLLLPNIIVQTVGGLALMRASTITLLFGSEKPKPGSHQHALAEALNIEMAFTLEESQRGLKHAADGVNLSATPANGSSATLAGSSATVVGYTPPPREQSTPAMPAGASWGMSADLAVPGIATPQPLFPTHDSFACEMDPPSGKADQSLLGAGLVGRAQGGGLDGKARPGATEGGEHVGFGAKLLEAPKQSLLRGLAELRRHARLLKLNLRPQKLNRKTTMIGILMFPITLTCSLGYMIYRTFTPSSVGTSFQYVSTPIFFATVPIVFYGVLNFAYRYSSLHIPLVHFWKYDLFDVSPEVSMISRLPSNARVCARAQINAPKRMVRVQAGGKAAVGPSDMVTLVPVFKLKEGTDLEKDVKPIMDKFLATVMEGVKSGVEENCFSCFNYRTVHLLSPAVQNCFSCFNYRTVHLLSTTVNCCNYNFTISADKQQNCFNYNFTISADKQQVICRESYMGAKGLMAHIKNVDTCLGMMSEKSDLMKVEIHGPQEELDQMEGLIKELNAEVWVMY
eukprot:gene11225-18853_t